MKLTLLILLLLLTTAVQDQEAPAESKTVSFADAPVAPVASEALTARRRVFGDRDARRLGITFGSVHTALKELKASGVINGEESNAELAVVVAEHISSKAENKAFFAAAGDKAPNWDAILTFLEKLIALILKLIPLFV